jgi:hypothetical protein
MCGAKKKCNVYKLKLNSKKDTNLHNNHTIQYNIIKAQKHKRTWILNRIRNVTKQLSITCLWDTGSPN